MLFRPSQPWSRRRGVRSATGSLDRRGKTIAAASAPTRPGTGPAPYTIATSGNYCLTGNLTSTASGTAAAITISANNVQLDLNGHSIVGPGGTTAGYGVYALARSGLRIRNGNLRGFSRGVFLADNLVGFPPITPSGASSRHEVSELRVEGASIGISVLGHFSDVHDNKVLDSSQTGISVGGSGGGIQIRNNSVLNTLAPVGSSTSVYGISAGGTGTLIQDNLINGLRGPANSAAIYAGGNASIVSRNRESDLGTAYAVFCASQPSASKVEGNIHVGPGANGGVSGCTLLGTNG